MLVKDLKQKTDKDLNKLLLTERDKLRSLKFDLAAGKVKNVKQSRQIKKDIARILTTLNQKNEEKN
jgi:ribosomal protein L29